MTFSIVARANDASLFGIAIASSSPAVAARCAHARAHLGAVATQNITNPALGPAVLAEIGRTSKAQAALNGAMATEAFPEYRQLLAIGPFGPPAVHSGSRALGVHGTAVGAHAAAGGNLLARPDVPQAMVDAFERASGHFGDRLLTAMRAATALGGEAGPIHSAGLLIVRDVSWPIVDLRVDWTEDDPIEALAAIWHIYSPQIDDYVRRAREPAAAPSFNVPGDP
jgi:uncharacterized Ntn-hydrolase superfamily protein